MYLIRRPGKCYPDVRSVTKYYANLSVETLVPTFFWPKKNISLHLATVKTTECNDYLSRSPQSKWYFDNIWSLATVMNTLLDISGKAKITRSCRQLTKQRWPDAWLYFRKTAFSAFCRNFGFFILLAKTISLHLRTMKIKECIDYFARSPQNKWYFKNICSLAKVMITLMGKCYSTETSLVKRLSDWFRLGNIYARW